MSTPTAAERFRDSGRVRGRVVGLALLADLACVVVFAAAGRGSHEPGASGWVVLAIVWPFAAALLLAHVGLLRAGRSSGGLRPGGVVVLATTYVLGLALRVVSGRGVAPGFLVVTLLFLAVTMLGWRAARLLLARRGRTHG